jgi:Fe2+ or Zn2+ uptake regulation protein
MARPSHVRDAVATLIARGGHDWSAEDVAEALRADGVRADPSSVFRALARLEAEGDVRRVVLGDGRTRYETAGEHHEHVRCERCGAVGEVPGCVVPRVNEVGGFAITGHQLLFTGLCPECR